MQTPDEAIVLAGGFGTRIQQLLADVPKPMAPVAGKPFLHYVMQYLLTQGIRHVILSIGYRAEVIQNHFGEEYLQMRISYEVESRPLGTGGAIKAALRHVTSPHCFIVNGDSLFRISMEKMWEVHHKNDADVTIALKPMKDFDRYGTVELGANGRITAFNEKEHMKEGLINGGVYLVNSDLFGGNLPEAFSIEKEFFAAQVGDQRILGAVFDDYFIDIGIPEDYERAQLEIV